MLALILDEIPRLIERKISVVQPLPSTAERAAPDEREFQSSAVALRSMKKAIRGFASLHRGHFVFSSF